MTPQAHPYRDLAVIDSRAPRTNQTVVAIVASIAVATGEWWLLAVLAAQLSSTRCTTSGVMLGAGP